MPLDKDAIKELKDVFSKQINNAYYRYFVVLLITLNWEKFKRYFDGDTEAIRIYWPHFYEQATFYHIYILPFLGAIVLCVLMPYFRLLLNWFTSHSHKKTQDTERSLKYDAKDLDLDDEIKIKRKINTALKLDQENEKIEERLNTIGDQEALIAKKLTLIKTREEELDTQEEEIASEHIVIKEREKQISAVEEQTSDLKQEVTMLKEMIAQAETWQPRVTSTSSHISKNYRPSIDTPVKKALDNIPKITIPKPLDDLFKDKHE